MASDIERWKTSSEAWKKSHAEMHRRAQKAEGALKAAINVLEGWEKTISHYDLPKHDLLVRSIKSQLAKALSRADDQPEPADPKPFTFADPRSQAEWERQRKERGE